MDTQSVATLFAEVVFKYLTVLGDLLRIRLVCCSWLRAVNVHPMLWARFAYILKLDSDGSGGFDCVRHQMSKSRLSAVS